MSQEAFLSTSNIINKGDDSSLKGLVVDSVLDDLQPR